jgi:hypothetical protein
LNTNSANQNSQFNTATLLREGFCCLRLIIFPKVWYSIPWFGMENLIFHIVDAIAKEQTTGTNELIPVIAY